MFDSRYTLLIEENVEIIVAKVANFSKQLSQALWKANTTNY